jgi:signal transduction histidine kinase
MFLSSGVRGEHAEPIVSAIEELDRLTEFLNTSLDVAEAKADALRLNRSEIDLNELLRSMIDLYEPSMVEKGLTIRFQGCGRMNVMVDAALIHRVIANLLDNALKHLPASSSVSVRLRAEADGVVLLVEDNGPGFDADVMLHMFEQRVKGRESKGHGLGLAFVEAVVRAHGGTVTASNREEGGVRLVIVLPVSGVALGEANGSVELAAK